MPNNKGRRRRFGAVRQLPSKKWQTRYPDPTSKLINPDRTFVTKTAAEEWLTDTESEMRRGDWVDPRGDTVFGTFATAWIKERPNLRPCSRELYSILLRLHLKPTFGNAALSAIKEADVRRRRATRLEGGLGLSPTAKAYRLMRPVMNTAVDDGLIGRNPCRIKGGGDEKAPERPTLTIGQVLRPRGRCRSPLPSPRPPRRLRLPALGRTCRSPTRSRGPRRGHDPHRRLRHRNEQRKACHRPAEVGRRQANRHYPRADPPRPASAHEVVRREGVGRPVLRRPEGCGPTPLQLHRVCDAGAVTSA
ncbi:hypothetical protein GT354_25010 [Streptomyces sp. SID3343]|nr:hypothetical protein [Streptomyces sp. SID3343]